MKHIVNLSKLTQFDKEHIATFETTSRNKVDHFIFSNNFDLFDHTITTYKKDKTIHNIVIR